MDTSTTVGLRRSSPPLLADTITENTSSEWPPGRTERGKQRCVSSSEEDMGQQPTDGDVRGGYHPFLPITCHSRSSHGSHPDCSFLARDDPRAQNSNGDDHGNGCHNLIEIAKKRWLRTEEVVHLLTPETTALPLTQKVPPIPPPSGTLLLYDRKVTRYFRNDGHAWATKGGSSGKGGGGRGGGRRKKLREDIVKLRVGGKARACCCYAHGSEIPTLHRRVYHLLSDEAESNSGAASQKQEGTAEASANSRKGESWKSPLVLVHYLDTSEADALQPNLSPERMPPSVGNCDDDRGGGMSPSAEEARSCNGVVFPVQIEQEEVGGGRRLEREGEEDLLSPLVVSPDELLPELQKFSPGTAPLFEPTKLTLSPAGRLHNPQMDPPCVEDGEFWQNYVAFVDLCTACCDGGRDYHMHIASQQQEAATATSPDLVIQKAYLSPLRQVDINPLCYECDVPETISAVGHRSIVLVAVHHTKNERATPFDVVVGAVENYLQSECNDALKCSDYSSGDEDDDGLPRRSPDNRRIVRPNFFVRPAKEICGVAICLLSQLSHSFFSVTPANVGGSVGRTSGLHGSNGGGIDLGGHPSVAAASPGFLPDSVPSHGCCPKASDHDCGQAHPHDATLPFHSPELTSLTSWFRGPKIDEEHLQKERQTMNFREMEAVLSDLHGKLVDNDRRRYVGATSVPQSDIERLDVTIITKVDPALKTAWLRARKECPGQVREHHALFLATCDADHLSMEEVANKLCSYWELRLRLFGEGKAFLPMTLSHALRDDLHALSHIDYVHYLPGAQDMFGRGICYKKGGAKFDPKMHDRASVARAAWYMYEAAMRSMRDPAKGLVILTCCGGMGLHNTDKELISAIYEVEAAFPIPIRAHHYCCMPWFTSVVWPGILFCMTKERRRRVKVHPGSHQEVLRGLRLHGIEPSMAPDTIGGGLVFDLQKWLEVRRLNGL